MRGVAAGLRAGHFACHFRVVRQQRADVGLRGSVRQRRIAGAQDPIGAVIDAELGPHRGLHVDLRQNSKAVALQSVTDAGGNRSDIMSIIICIMDMWSVII